jgi:hypothetical protein
MESKAVIPAQQIDKCPFCGNPANKTNAHLIPWFIIKHYVTQGGSGDRDKELSFSISTGHFTQLYAGRSVLPEKLEEFGNLHALEKENANPYSRDHLWCDKCEEKFSKLEAVFAIRFNERKIRNLADLPEHKNYKLVLDGGLHSSIYQLFVQSIFWRCSVGKFGDFTLKPETENKILENLQMAFVKADFHKLKASDSLPLMHSFPIITSLLHQGEEEDPTKNYIMVNKVNNPYFIMAGKWLFQLFEKEKQVRGTQEWLYGLKSGTDTTTLYPQIKEKSHVVLLNETLSNSFSDNRLRSVTEQKRRGLLRDILFAHEGFFGNKPSDLIQKYIFQQYLAHRDAGKTEFESFVHAFYDLKKLA